eukprot:14357688-Alexandrium_andersonii.AAC.1
MSASLVGSEMCIRDRGLSGKSSSAHGVPSLPKPKRPRRPGGVLTTSTAVSYTHLTLPTICSV